MLSAFIAQQTAAMWHVARPLVMSCVFNVEVQSEFLLWIGVQDSYLLWYYLPAPLEVINILVNMVFDPVVW